VDLLEIVRRTMNPKDPARGSTLHKGNFGRYNFSGSGPDGSYQDLLVGPVGGIVALPGAADQALHADTPHLFEHLSTMNLPAHYINSFTPGSHAHDDVGQTAFVHGSHQLNVTAAYFADDDNDTEDGLAVTTSGAQQQLWKHDLVRPRLEVGDVILFDCRILHFGLANTSSNIERPLLYTNMTMHWFQDPKNWDNERPIFDKTNDKEENEASPFS
jgi:ectoine hydroxylase-related dioxygenase (phytanoyl-CoA dioxygenase family)